MEQSKKQNKKHQKEESETSKNKSESQKNPDASKVSKKKELPYDPEITDSDLNHLQHENEHTDGGDDEILRNRKKKTDFTGKNLDVPGSQKAKRSRNKGMPDEENQMFSEDNKNQNN